MIRSERVALAWQSKAILLLVLPFTAIGVLLQTNWWIAQIPLVAWTTLGISALFGLIVWRLHAGTARAAATGAMITACLMYGTTQFPYKSSWLHGALVPLLSVFLLTFVATRLGQVKKQRLGLAENHHGRSSVQVAANLGVAALVVVIFPLIEIVLHLGGASLLGYVAVTAALAEAAADTVSSEIGQVLGGQPRMITTLHRVEPGTDGGVTFTGTAAGVAAAVIVALLAALATHPDRGLLGQWRVTLIMAGAGVAGLTFDSLLGATLERQDWLNNDAVNFISTAFAATSAVAAVIWLASRSML